MKVVFHIGIHKTGTTAIQHFCSANREKLTSLGVCYPAIHLKYQAHHNVPWALGVRHPDAANAVSAQELAAAMLRESSQAHCHTLIVSSEEFRNLESEAIRALKQLFAGHDVSIVVYLRRQDDFLISKYGQHVRMYTIRYSGTIYDFYFRHNFVARYNYQDLINRWANVFGTDNMIVQVYERQRFPDGDVIRDFFRLLKIEMPQDVDAVAKSINRTLQPMGLEILRRANQRPLESSKHAKLLQMLDQSDFSAYGRYELLTDRNRHDLLGLFRNSNALVARKWLGQGDGALFADPELSNLPQAQISSGIDDRLVGALLDGLLRVL